MNLSVILPVYNEEPFIGKCLSSLLGQTFPPKEIIVIDDGSTDRTPEIIESFVDERFKIVRLPRHKCGDIRRIPYVMREGTKRLSDEFEFLAVLDADTVLESDYYRKCVEALRRNPKYGIVGGELLQQPDVGAILGVIPYVYGCNRVYTRECWMRLNNGKIMKIVPTWDTYHNLYARMLGYRPKLLKYAKSYALRPARGPHPFERGIGSYELGYYPWFVIARAVKNMNPLIIAGYFKARFSGISNDYPIKQIVREVQIARVKRLVNKLLGERMHNLKYYLSKASEEDLLISATLKIFRNQPNLLKVNL